MLTLTHNIMRDGSRCFMALPHADRWEVVRDHVAKLEGATVTNFLTDGITEAWIDFSYVGHTFSINDAPGDYWFFVKDPRCAEPILEAVARHFVALLDPATSR